MEDDPAVRPTATEIIERPRAMGRDYQWRITSPDVPAPVPATRHRVSTRDTMAVAMSVALAASVPLFLPAAPKAETPAAAPVTVTLASAPTTTTRRTAAHDDHHDGGTPAFYAYLGASFLLPDWVSCESRYCLVGSGADVYLFTARPIKEVARFGADVPDPHQKLTGLGLTSAQADALLNRPS